MITITGLGPGDLDRVPEPVLAVLLDPSRNLIVRTRDHPAAESLARERSVVFCDDLYEASGSFDEVYEGIAGRVIEAAQAGPVVYAVPGSPMIGEYSVRRIVESGEPFEVIPAESFVDAILSLMGYDPFDRGLQILNGHDPGDPLVVDKPTIVGQVDSPEILADVGARLGKALGDEAVITVIVDAGGPGQRVIRSRPEGVDLSLAGPRTALFVDAEPGGLIGAVHLMRRLRDACPWDREQTHASLVKNLVEESYELIEAISGLPDEGVDWVAYARLEDELGDVLLQVLFHSAIARQAGAFDIDGVAEVMRQKLIRRHPHVFGDVKADTPEEVKENWERIKQAENTGASHRSVLDGVTVGMPALQRSSKLQNRAARVGFDWEKAADVLPVIQGELEELDAAMGGSGDVGHELGDVLFSIVNLARHLGLDPEISLARAAQRFEARFRRMEQEGSLEGLGLDGLNERWERAKE